MNVSDILQEYENPVVICHYRLQKTDDLYNGGHAPQNPACILQVTLLKSKISPSGKFLRLGDTRGDEITGWTKLEALEVVEVLGLLAEDGVTVRPLDPRGTIALEAA